MKLDIRKILVPVDFSETSDHATDHAAWLAATTQAELFLVHVMPQNHYYFETPEPFILPDNEAEVRQEIEEKLRIISREIFDKYNITTRNRVLHGRISYELIDLATSESIDIIMMGTHGAKGLEEILVGSNAQHLVSRAPCPVITFQQEKRKPGFSNIVLPIDRSRHSREKVGVAISIALLCNSKIHIVGLLDNDDEGEYQKLQIVLDQVTMAIDRAEISYTRHTVKGDNIAVEAMKYAESIHADLILILTEDESVLGKIDLGPLSRHIVNHCPIPVLSMNPHYGNFEALDLTGAYQAY
jgi:nucleotide-binding universal stress UspA family protein